MHVRHQIIYVFFRALNQVRASVKDSFAAPRAQRFPFASVLQVIFVFAYYPNIRHIDCPLVVLYDWRLNKLLVGCAFLAKVCSSENDGPHFRTELVSHLVEFSPVVEDVLGDQIVHDRFDALLLQVAVRLSET